MKLSTKSLSIHKITFLSYISLIIIIVLLMSLLIYTSIYPSLSELTEDNLVSEINYLSQSIETTLNKAIYSCELLSQNRELIEMSQNYSEASYIDQFHIGNDIKRLLNDYWSSHLSVESAYVILPGNKHDPLRTEFVYIESLDAMHSAQWFKSISELSTAVVVKPSEKTEFTPPYSKPNFVTVVNQLLDQSNTLIGYSVANLSLRHFESNFYNSDRLIPDSYIYTVDNLGNIIYANSTTSIEDFFDYKSAIATSSDKCLRSGKYSIICSKTSKHGWKTIQITPTAPLYKKLNVVKYITTIMIIIALSLGLLLSFILSRLTSIPIINLADNMKSFLKFGKLQKMDNAYDNEIGIIIKTYNNMIDRINQLIEDEKKHMHLRKQAELKMLQAQINPHFLYNTLDSISWQAIRNDVPSVGKLLNKLARLYQQSLYKGLDVQPLRKEIEQIELYMSLQQECFNSEFIYDIDINDDVLDLYIPRFILQPIIENSVIHGFGGTKTRGIITITAKVEENLTISISDNGKGIDFEIMNKINTNGYKSERYGILNIKERISLICGDSYGLNFSNNESLGTTATYTLPVCTDYNDFKGR